MRSRDLAVADAVAPTPRLRLAAWAISLLGLGLAFSGTLSTLWRVWRHNPNYSHGILIPPIFLFLLWRQRTRLAEETDLDGSLWGLLLLVPGLLLQLIGLRGDMATVQGAALILCIGGVGVHLLGLRAAKRIVFPVLFLIFMIPTIPWFMNVASFNLKLVAARGAVAISHGLGITVDRDGVNLIFPGGVLGVENACSGLRSLVALVALGALVAYFARGAFLKRLFLFLLALPIAVVANVVRIAGLCVYATLASVEGAAGLFHDIGGYVLFVIAFLFLDLCRRLLRC